MVHSAAGVPLPPGGLVRRATFRAPHHTSSMVSLVGGGSSPATGRDQPGARRRAVPGRARRVPGRCARRAPPAARGRVSSTLPAPTCTASCRRGSCSSRRPTRARAAVAPRGVRVRRRRDARATSAGSPGRCSTASTSASPSIVPRSTSCSPASGGEPTAVVARPGGTGASIAIERSGVLNAGCPGRCSTGSRRSRRPRTPLRDELERNRLTGRGYHRIRRVARTLADLDDPSHRELVDVDHVPLALLDALAGAAASIPDGTVGMTACPPPATSRPRRIPGDDAAAVADPPRPSRRRSRVRGRQSGGVPTPPWPACSPTSSRGVVASRALPRDRRRVWERAATAASRLVTARRSRLSGTALHDPLPPPVLFVRGDPARSMAGGWPSSAHATQRRQAASVPGPRASASRRRGDVVSGLARGIDGAAHRGALAAGDGPASVARWPSSAPAPMSSPRGAPSSCGARSSSSARSCPRAAGLAARAYRFPLRNRIIAALRDPGRGRARERGGSLITAARRRARSP